MMNSHRSHGGSHDDSPNMSEEQIETLVMEAYNREQSSYTGYYGPDDPTDDNIYW